jgi:hypothetical protein
MSITDYGFDDWAESLLETLSYFPIAVAVTITVATAVIGYRSKYLVLGRRDYLTDPEDLRTFDEQEALEKWKRENEQGS